MAVFALQNAACIDSPQAAAIVDYLLKAGTETSFRGDPGQNLLFLAALSGSTRTIDVLLNFFKGTDIPDDVRQKAFNAAAVRPRASEETNHPVDTLAEGFFRLNNDFDLARFAPEALCLAVEKVETPDGLRALLDNMSEKKAKALVAAQPNLLKMAVRAQDAEKVRLLCKTGADPLALSDDNPTSTIMEEALNMPRTDTRMEIIQALAEQILTCPLIQPTKTTAPRRARPG
jgi:ribosomal protein L7/L12